MARVVLIADSETGALIDVAGNVREGDRYKKFAKRMLSAGTNPVLDYGGNGGDSLEISKGGGNGTSINLKANTVNVSGELKVGGDTVADIAYGQSSRILGNIIGATGKITVDNVTVTDQESGESRECVQISLDQSVVTALARISNALDDMPDMVTKNDIKSVVAGLSADADDPLDITNQTLKTLLERLGSLGGDGNA